MDEKTLKDKLKKFVRKYRNYSDYWNKIDLANTVGKIFNQGRGKLDFYRVYPDKRIIAVNKVVWNRTDERKLEDLKSILGGEWRIVWCRLGYPLWYEHWLGLDLAIDENERKL